MNTESFLYDETEYRAGATAIGPDEPVEDIYAAPQGLADQPVPRITIAAFCELPETGALVQAASEDRRLSRAHVDVRSGGLPAAIEMFHDQSTPNLIIVESGMRGRGLFEQLDELANVCDPDTKVMIIGATNDIALYRELMRRGVSEYLVPPLTPVGLIRAVSAQYVDAEAPFVGKTVAFIGAKGGVGSSTVAHNIAWSISETAGVDTALADLDLSFGTAGLDFNQDSMQGIADALSQPDRVDDVMIERLLTRCTDRLTLFSAPCTLDREWELPVEAYETVIEIIAKTTPLVALDLPHQWSSWIKRMLLSVDDVVITATPDLACLRNAKNMFDIVSAARPNDVAPRIVLNMVGMPKRPEIPLKDFAEAVGVQPQLVLPFDAALFGQAANNGQMVADVNASSKPAEAMRTFAAGLVGRETEVPSGSFLDKLKLLKRK